jgi:hypothetical protein
VVDFDYDSDRYELKHQAAVAETVAILTQEPRKMIADGAGGVWLITASFNHEAAGRLHHFTAAGQETVNRATFRTPEALVAGKNQAVWLHDRRPESDESQAGRLTLVSADGAQVTEITLDSPMTLESDTQGGVWVLDDEGELQRYDATAKPVALAETSVIQGYQPTLLAAGPDSVWIRADSMLYLATVDGIEERSSKFRENTLAPDGKGGFWTSFNGDKLNLVHGSVNGEITKTSVPDLAPYDNSTFRPDGQGGVWARTSDGLVHCDADGEVLTRSKLGNVWHLRVAPEAVWVVIDGELAKVAP